MPYQNILDEFVDITRQIMEEKLTGIYLHGSMAMGCFNATKSDIDLIVIVEECISDTQKMQLMELVVRLNKQAPAKGLEISVVKREYCNPFVYPTPFELHFSPAHLQWFHDDPQGYIENMNGVDIDLAAHFSIINHYGIVLYGEAVEEARHIQQITRSARSGPSRHRRSTHVYPGYYSRRYVHCPGRG